MFKVIGDKILFKDQIVATIAPEVRYALRCDVIEELENHLSILQVEKMKIRLHRLELESREVSIDEYLSAR